MPDLKPCPSCGGKAEHSVASAVCSDHIECTAEGCDLFGPSEDPDGTKWNALPRHDGQTQERLALLQQQLHAARARVTELERECEWLRGEVEAVSKRSNDAYERGAHHTRVAISDEFGLSTCSVTRETVAAAKTLAQAIRDYFTAEREPDLWIGEIEMGAGALAVSAYINRKCVYGPALPLYLGTPPPKVEAKPEQSEPCKSRIRELEESLSDNGDLLVGLGTRIRELERERERLASAEREPVGWLWEKPTGGDLWTRELWFEEPQEAHGRRQWDKVTPLYAAPPEPVSEFPPELRTTGDKSIVGPGSHDRPCPCPIHNDTVSKPDPARVEAERKPVAFMFHGDDGCDNLTLDWEVEVECSCGAGRTGWVERLYGEPDEKWQRVGPPVEEEASSGK